MEKIDRIINQIRSLREESAAAGIVNSANAPGSGGSLGSNSPNSNMQGFDPLMAFKRRRGNNGLDFRSVPKQYRKWIIG
jgi:hypothetical protein